MVNVLWKFSGIVYGSYVCVIGFLLMCWVFSMVMLLCWLVVLSSVLIS